MRNEENGGSVSLGPLYLPRGVLPSFQSMMQGEFSMLVKVRVPFTGFFAIALLLLSVKVTLAADPATAKSDKAASPARLRRTVQHGQDAHAQLPLPQFCRRRRSTIRPPRKNGSGGQAEAKKVKQLSPEMVERRDRLRRLLAALRNQPFNTQQNTCTDVLDFCRAFGCETELTDSAGRPEGQRHYLPLLEYALRRLSSS